MEETSIVQYITGMFTDIQVETADASFFFFPGAERQFPFATLVTKNSYDSASNLNRPGIFRLNIGISKPTYLSLFGAQPSRPGAAGVVETGHDFTALDQLMPHPVYAQMFWVCVLNPGEATFGKVRPLLAEAYGLAAGRHAQRTAAGTS